MKPRVPLYGCSPCAIGTPLVESLTGFVGRLAVARRLPASAIFEHLVRPRVPEGVVRESLHLTSFLASGSGYVRRSRIVGLGARRRVDRADRASGSVAPHVVALARISLAPQRRSALASSQALVLSVPGRLAPSRHGVVGALAVADLRGPAVSSPSHPILGPVSSVPCAAGRGRRDRSFRLLP